MEVEHEDDMKIDMSMIKDETALFDDPEMEGYLHRLAAEDDGNVPQAAPPEYIMTGRPPQILYLSCDGEVLSGYQQLLRKQIEFFEASPDDVNAAAQGRNKPIVRTGRRCV